MSRRERQSFAMDTPAGREIRRSECAILAVL
jgi:hypothetical protein